MTCSTTHSGILLYFGAVTTDTIQKRPICQSQETYLPVTRAPDTRTLLNRIRTRRDSAKSKETYLSVKRDELSVKRAHDSLTLLNRIRIRRDSAKSKETYLSVKKDVFVR